MVGLMTRLDDRTGIGLGIALSAVASLHRKTKPCTQCTYDR